MALRDNEWARAGKEKKGRSTKTKEGKSSINKSVYGESGNIGAAALGGLALGRKIDQDDFFFCVAYCLTFSLIFPRDFQRTYS